MFRDYKIAYLLDNLAVRERRPQSFLRQSVGYLLSQSARSIPHAAWNNDYDVTPLIEYAASGIPNPETDAGSSEDKLLRRALRRNYSAFFVKTLAHCLYHVPAMNGFLDYTPLRNGGTFYIRRHK